MTRRIGAGLGLLVLAVAGLAWQPWSGVGEPVGAANWVVVEPRVLERRLGLLGRIQPARHLVLAAPFEGTVESLSVGEGERVEAGQVLLTLDTGLLEIQLREAEAQQLKADRALREWLAWESGPEVARAQRALTVARRQVDNSQAALVDTRGLFERGIVARQEVDTLEQQIGAQRLELVGAEQELRQAHARGQGEQVRIARMELSSAQARYARLAGLRSQAVVKAPFAGVVTRPAEGGEQRARSIQAGELASQGMPLMGLVALEHLQVAAAVEQVDIGKVREGMPAQVTGEGFVGHELSGWVDAISLQARDEPGQGAWFDVRVRLAAQPDPLAAGARLGMQAQVSLSLYRNDHGLAVPEPAIRVDEAGESYVIYRATPQHAARKHLVRVRGAVLQGVEIEGIAAGEVLMP